MIRTLILAVILLVSIPYAQAEEKVLAERVIGIGGMICDTPAEVRQAIDGVIPQGCGQLVRPMVMRVTAVEEYQGKYIVRYDFLDAPQLPPQYGIVPLPKTKGLEI